MPAFNPMQPHVSDGLVQVIANRLDNLHGDVSDMKTVLKELVTAVSRLAVIEERQGQATQALERVFTGLKELETRVSVLEIAHPANKKTNEWIDKAVLVIIGAVLTFVAKKVGLM